MIYSDEGNVSRVIPLVSDDNGITWYPKGGDPLTARYVEGKAQHQIRLISADSGITWTPKV